MSAIYVAIVCQTGFDESALIGTAPSLTAAVAAWAVVSHRRARGVWWAAIAGFACDAAGHGRLGLHLSTYGVFAAVVAFWLTSERRPAWMTILAAAVISGGDELVGRLLLPSTDGRVGPIAHLLASLQSAVATAGVVFAVVALLWAMCRVLGRDAASPVRLANRWSMLTE
jgi:cell shape-determining protein MreD